jgi:hypothetical protein
MSGGEGNKPLASVGEQRVGDDQESSDLPRNKSCKGRIELVFVDGMNDVDLPAQ